MSKQDEQTKTSPAKTSNLNKFIIFIVLILAIGIIYNQIKIMDIYKKQQELLDSCFDIQTKIDINRKDILSLNDKIKSYKNPNYEHFQASQLIMLAESFYYNNNYSLTKSSLAKLKSLLDNYASSSNINHTIENYIDKLNNAIYPDVTTTWDIIEKIKPELLNNDNVDLAIKGFNKNIINIDNKTPYPLVNKIKKWIQKFIIIKKHDNLGYDYFSVKAKQQQAILYVNHIQSLLCQKKPLGFLIQKTQDYIKENYLDNKNTAHILKILDEIKEQSSNPVSIDLELLKNEVSTFFMKLEQ